MAYRGSIQERSYGMLQWRRKSVRWQASSCGRAIQKNMAAVTASVKCNRVRAVFLEGRSTNKVQNMRLCVRQPNAGNNRATKQRRTSNHNAIELAGPAGNISLRNVWGDIKP